MRVDESEACKKAANEQHEDRCIDEAQGLHRTSLLQDREYRVRCAATKEALGDRNGAGRCSKSSARRARSLAHRLNLASAGKGHAWLRVWLSLCMVRLCAPIAITSPKCLEASEDAEDRQPDDYGVKSYWNDSYTANAYGHLYDWYGLPAC